LARATARKGIQITQIDLVRSQIRTACADFAQLSHGHATPNSSRCNRPYKQQLPGDMPDDNEQMIKPTMHHVNLKALIVVAATFVIPVNIARE
jgi:hypothetical protein